jgi:D-lactate dehydrogenase
MDVWFYEAFDDEERGLRAALGDGLQAGYSRNSIQESGHTDPPAAIVSIRTQSAIPPAWAGRLAAVLTRSTGYEHVQRYRRDHAPALPCGCLPKYCGQAVAEHAAMLWMALLRRLPAQLAQMPRFARDGLTGGECAGRNLLVVGVGDIGHRTALIGRGLGVSVRGVDVVRRWKDVDYTTLAEGLPWADVIVCAMNLTAANRCYFAYDTLVRARRGAIFVNVSRGEFAPPADLLRLLAEDALGGVGLDVYDEETTVGAELREGTAQPSAATAAVRALMAHPRALLTPHNAFNTAEAVERKCRFSVEEIRHFLACGRFKTPVPADEAG